jgi:ubiquinone/menaquinone biosynthesis C-methylase UbiE
VERYVIRGGREGYERLQILSRSRWPDTSDLFELSGVRPGMRCVDLGCGGGDVTLELARLVGPEGHVTGLDVDQVKLDLGWEAAAARGISNVELRVADVNEWEDPGGYDFVYCRCLLQHLSAPVDLLRRMWAAVKPGGTIAVEDADFDGEFCEPPNEHFDFYSRMYRTVLGRRGGDPTSARRLYRSFVDAGIPLPSARLVQRVDAEGESKTIPVLTLQATAEPIVEEGLATVEEIEAALAGLAAYVADPETLIAQPRVFQLWRRRD